tara:strand:+ start:219 stop:428 length:210 start_codon:yes stop_codon:yes gene_type:complete
VFIKVRIEILNPSSKFTPENVSNEERTNKEIIKIIIDKKYLFISSISKLVLENNKRFMNIFLGLLNDSI